MKNYCCLSLLADVSALQPLRVTGFEVFLNLYLIFFFQESHKSQSGGELKSCSTFLLMKLDAVMSA